MENRTTYKELKRWFFEEAYRWCQSKFRYGHVHLWGDDESEWGGALDTYGETFEYIIENLMVDVIFIITNVARHELAHHIVFKRIQLILLENKLEDLLHCLSDDEKREFLYDLDLVLNNTFIEK